MVWLPSIRSIFCDRRSLFHQQQDWKSRELERNWKYNQANNWAIVQNFPPQTAQKSYDKPYSDPKSFVNFLLPDREFGEGWGGVKNLRLLQGLP